MKLNFRLRGLHTRALPNTVMGKCYSFVYIGNTPNGDEELDTTVAFGSEKDKIFYSETHDGIFGPWINYGLKKL